MRLLERRGDLLAGSDGGVGRASPSPTAKRSPSELIPLERIRLGARHLTFRDNLASRAHMIRQFWIFLAPEDETPFLASLEAIDPGMMVVPSRYIRGDTSALISKGIDGLEFPTLTNREARRYVFHRRHSTVARIFPVTEGPLAGTSYVDETRSDCLLLVRPEPDGKSLAPSRLTGEIVRFSGGGKEKRSTAFIGWVNRVMKALPEHYVASPVEFIHVAPAALAFSRSGGELRYLHQRIEPERPKSH
jgi:hypothetical protein